MKNITLIIFSLISFNLSAQTNESVDYASPKEYELGGIIVEGTAGNTGIGLGLVGNSLGYKTLIVMPETQSQEKKDALRLIGCELKLVPALPYSNPGNYIRQSQQIAEDLSKTHENGVLWANQFDNVANQMSHYNSTGPEIWEQTDGKVDAFTCAVGTGGTLSGTGLFLKEKNKKIKIWGIDTYGSVFKKFHETGIFDKNEIYPYSTEGIGEDIIPKNVDFSLIDFFEKVNDKDAAIYTRKLALDEGIFAGNSCGAAIKGLIQLKGNFTSKDVIVVLLHDSGSRYLAKIYNDEWMKSKKFI